jgi:hypothetical protein
MARTYGHGTGGTCPYPCTDHKHYAVGHLNKKAKQARNDLAQEYPEYTIKVRSQTLVVNSKY